MVKMVFVVLVMCLMIINNFVEVDVGGIQI